jgi:hypothetical protein
MISMFAVPMGSGMLSCLSCLESVFHGAVSRRLNMNHNLYSLALLAGKSLTSDDVLMAENP